MADQVVPLDDGNYNVMVLDAEVGDHSDAPYQVDITILDGEHKGQVLTLKVASIDQDLLDLLGMPGTLTVEEGAHTLSIEP